VFHRRRRPTQAEPLVFSGHSDPRLTLGIYAQATSAGDKAAAELLGAQFLGASRTQRAHETGTEAGNRK
jgi:hypothetical protein